MRNLLLILACLIFVVGCGNALKNSWNDFRAYYNTYYNAQENFRAGLKKVEEQPVTIDPDKPVRIHPAPVQAGNSDFQKAIDKGARILRKFPGSKWADDALLLIGKSYYYRQEFYPALQKFEELRDVSTSPKMEQSAIIWKGITQLDLKLNNEAATFLRSELNLYPNEWSTERKAEIQALAGEHHAMLENWEQSAQFLSAAVSNITDKKLLGRTFFLYGQVLERLERYGEAYFTYSKVSENFPGFEYIFWARFKQADVARKEGNLDQAISIYQGLRKDDKNYLRRNELTYEIARTLEMKGEIQGAVQRYNELLQGDQSQQQRSLKADIYYRLGKIYSDQYNDYSVAAAYFDSSSAISDTPEKIDATEGAKSLADAFGKYTLLQKTINRADSLLWLGSLSKVQLDSALERIREQKRTELLKAQESESQNILANRNLSEVGNQTTSSSSYGFLNHRNSSLVNQSREEFKLIWGDRPLIDNWRRIEVVRQSNVSRRSGLRREEEAIAGVDAGISIDMNLEEIPKTPAEMRKLQSEKVNAQYELGNLFFLNLNLPDSASYYFRKVIENDASKELRPRAMYSLFELYKSSGNQDSLLFWGQRILDEYPTSRYARRVETRLNGTSDGITEPDSSEKIILQFQEILSSEEANKPGKLRKLALANRTSELAPYIYYQSIESYIREAKAKTSADFLTKNAENISADSSISVASMENNLTFRGAYWDSVRLAVEEFNTTFPQAQQQPKVAKLREMLSRPQSLTNLPTCESLGVALTVKPSMDDFLSTVDYPNELDGMSISGEVVYSFVVSAAGEVESYELLSKQSSMGIEAAFEEAFKKSLYFEPLKLENPPQRAQCKVSFPIQH